jgi:hypothetical protein
LENLFDETRSADSGPSKKTSTPTSGTEKELAVHERPTGRETGARTAAGAMQRELSLMGFAGHTAAKGAEKVSFETKEKLFEQMENRIRVSGAEAVFKVQFRHVVP